MGNGKERLKAPKQNLMNSPQSGLAGKEVSGKRPVVGNVTEEVTWARQDRALSGRHYLGFFLWTTARNHSFLSNKEDQRL